MRLLLGHIPGYSGDLVFSIFALFEEHSRWHSSCKYLQPVRQVLNLNALGSGHHTKMDVFSSGVHVLLVSLLVDQLSGLFLIFFGRPIFFLVDQK